MNDLKNKIKILEEQLLKYGGARIQCKLNIACKRLELYDTSKIQRNILYLKRCYATKSPQALRWIRWKVNKNMSSRFITTLRKKGREPSSRSSEILEEFTDFYKNLYLSSEPSMEKVKQFLQKHNFKKRLTEEHRIFLENPITAAELTSILKSQKNGKAIGRDGLPIEFYKRFAEDIVPPLLATCNNILKTGHSCILE